MTAFKMKVYKNLPQLHCSLCRTDDVSNTHTEVFINNYNFALSQQLTIDMNINWLTSQPVKLDNRSCSHLKNLLNRLLGTSQLYSNLQWNVKN